MNITPYNGPRPDVLHALSSENLDKLSGIIKEFEIIPIRYCGYSGRTHKDYRSTMHATIDGNDGDKFKDEVQSYVRDQAQIKNYRWLVLQRDALKKGVTWARLKAAANGEADKRAVLSLRRKWKRHEEYVHCSSEALRQIYQRTLKSLLAYTEFAINELMEKRGLLDEDEYRVISDYFTRLKTEVSVERVRVTEAMLARLQVASKQEDLTYDDVIIDLLHLLKKFKVLRDDTTIPEARRTFTGELFEMFHVAIREQAVRRQVKALKFMSWLIPGSKFSTMESTLERVLVPVGVADLERDISRAGGVLQRFVQTEHSVMKYFMKKVYLTAKINWFGDNAATNSDAELLLRLDESGDWVAFCKSLEDELEHVERLMPRGLIGRVVKHKKSVLLVWDQCLRDHKLKLLQRQIDLLATIANRIGSLEKVGDGFVLTKEQADKVRLLRAKTNESMVGCDLPADVLRKYQRVKDIINDMDEKAKIVREEIKKTLAQLKSGFIAGDERLDTLYAYAKQLKDREGDAYHEFQVQCTPAITTTFDSLKQIMDKVVEGVRSSIQDRDNKHGIVERVVSERVGRRYSAKLALARLVRAANLIDELGLPEQQKQYQQYLKKMIVHYLGYCMDVSKHDKSFDMSKYEKLFIGLADAALKKKLQLLTEVRIGCEWKSYTAHCRLVREELILESIDLKSSHDLSRLDEMIYAALQYREEYERAEVERLKRVKARMIERGVKKIENILLEYRERRLLYPASGKREVKELVELSVHVNLLIRQLCQYSSKQCRRDQLELRRKLDVCLPYLICPVSQQGREIDDVTAYKQGLENNSEDEKNAINKTI